MEVACSTESSLGGSDEFEHAAIVIGSRAAEQTGAPSREGSRAVRAGLRATRLGIETLLSQRLFVTRTQLP